MHRIFGHGMVLATTLVVSCCVGRLVHASPSFTPYHAYSVLDGGWIVEWDLDLNEIRRFQLDGFESVSGATFNSAGNLVFLGRRPSTVGVGVFEIDASGNVLREFDAQQGPFLAGSYIDFDSSRGLFAVARRHQVILLNEDLTFHSELPYWFERASGVTFVPNGGLYATDQLDSQLVEFDEQFTFVGAEHTGPGTVPTGMDATEDWLFLTDYGFGSLFRYDLGPGARTTLVDRLGFGYFSDVEVLPDGRLLTARGNGFLDLWESDGTFITSNTHPGFTGDGVAFLVPSPASGCTVLMWLLLRRHRRRAPLDEIT